MDQVEEVKRKTDIVALISEIVELKKTGRNYKGLCPFHGEKTPSFIVSEEIQIYKCFGCGVGGDAFRFLMEYEKVDFPQALKILADRAGVALKPLKGFATYSEKEELYTVNFFASEFYHYLLLNHPVGKKALEYLKKRGIGKEAIKIFKLGFSPEKPDALFNYLTKKRSYKPEILEKAGIILKSQRGYFDRFRGRVIFPLNDHFGNCLGFAGRVLEAKGDIAKYINSPETLVYKKGHVLYALEITKHEIKTQGFAVIVEGEIDCISSHLAGVKNIVAIKGSAITPEQATLLSRFTSRVVLALDADFAGDQASRRGLDILQNAGLTVEIADLGEFKDPDEMARNNPQGLVHAISQAQGMYDFLINLSFKRFGTDTTEAKSQVSRELTPILASIEDEIVRAHCIKQVALRLGVSEDAVAAQVQKNQPQRSSAQSQERQKVQIRTRRDILEEQLLAHLLQIKPETLLESKIEELIKTQSRRELLKHLSHSLQYNTKFNPIQFTESLPAELSQTFQQLLLVEVVNEGEKASKEEERLIHELEVLNLKEQMKQISDLIQDNESQGKTEKLAELEQKLSNLGNKLSNFEKDTL